MTRRDQELLNKQLKWQNPSPRNNGLLILALVGVFLAGIALGGSRTAHENKAASVSSKIAVASSVR